MMKPLTTWIIAKQCARFRMGDPVRWRQGGKWVHGEFMAAQTGWALVAAQLGAEHSTLQQVFILKLRKAKK